MDAMGGDLLQQAEQFLRDGNKEAALPILMEYVRRNPDNARAWWMLGFTVTDPKQQMECLERVLRLAPENTRARDRLHKLKTGSVVAGKVSPSRNNNRVLLASLLSIFLCGGLGVFAFLLALKNNSQGFFPPSSNLIPLTATQPVFTQTLPVTWTPTMPGTPTLVQNIVPVETSFSAVETVAPDRIIVDYGHGLPIGTKAPDFTLKNSANGQKLSLSDYTGQPVIIYFVRATDDCSFCTYNATEMQKIYDDYKDQGVMVLGINIGGFSAGEEGPGLKQGLRYQESLNLTHPILNDWQAKAFQAYKGDAYPINYFIDSQGMIHDFFWGSMEYTMINIKLRLMLDLIPTPAP
jgi:peroxiredoxin